MIQDALSKPKRTRTVTHRSRNGCITCKFRKVRCDETLPLCSRCAKYGIQCDGYTSAQALSRKHFFGPKILLPKADSNSNSGARGVSILNLNSGVFKQLFKNEHEYRFFGLFCTKTAKRISGHFSSVLWQRLILQSSEREEVIRHAVIALGALIYISSSSSLSHERKIQRKEFAYHQYHLSISLLRKQTQIPTTTTTNATGENGTLHPEILRTTLLACLLYAIFETYNGYITSATSQIYAGIRLLSDWQHSHTYLSSQISSFVSPSPLIIEPELISAFSEMESEAMCRHDPRSSSLHEEYRYFGQMFVDRMPERFGDVGEARGYLVLVGQRALHFTAWMKKGKEVRGVGLRCPEVEGREEEMEMKGATRRMEREYDAWERAFENLWDGGGLGVEKKVLVLRIQLLTARAWSKVLDVGEERFGVKNKVLLEEIVKLVRRVREGDEQREGYEEDDGNFVFEGGLITALRTVGFVFRHRRLKREAMQILLERPWKEGLWDTWIVGKAMEWLIGIEDEGLVGLEGSEGNEEVEYVTEDRVLRDFQMCQDEVGRRTIVSGFKPVQRLYGEVLERRELIIPWLE